jgi:hypothetical protein
LYRFPHARVVVHPAHVVRRPEATNVSPIFSRMLNMIVPSVRSAVVRTRGNADFLGIL